MSRRLAAVVVAALAFAAPALATIVPQHGIRGVTLGMSPDKVKGALGNPAKTTQGTNDFGHWIQLEYAGLTVGFQSGSGATSISTASSTERTAAGIGVGSTIQDVLAKVPAVKCVNDVGYLHCYVGTWTPGQIVTDFSLKGGRVSRVLVGRVLD